VETEEDAQNSVEDVETGVEDEEATSERPPVAAAAGGKGGCSVVTTCITSAPGLCSRLVCTKARLTTM
jgi:hypothetical protein